MARYFDVHPIDPQPRALSQLTDLLNEGAVVALPTDSGYALVCRMSNHEGAERIRKIRDLKPDHHLSVLVSDFGQLGQLVQLSNSAFRAVKAATPGPYTFILPATREVPKRLAHPKKRTIGIRIPDHVLVQRLVAALGEPLVSATLIMPGEEAPLTDGWSIKELLDHQVDAVVDIGECAERLTTVVDYSEDVPEVLRYGAGDPGRFE